MAKALDSVGVGYEIFDRAVPNPTIDSVYDGADAAKSAGADLIIAIGGGSPMDTAKAIALLAAQDIPRDRLFSGNYTKDILPTVFVPTTAGTGSEVTQYSILTDDAAKTKKTIASPGCSRTSRFSTAGIWRQCPTGRRLTRRSTPCRTVSRVISR